MTARKLNLDHPDSDYVNDLMHNSIVQHNNNIPLNSYSLINVFKIDDPMRSSKFWDRIKRMKRKLGMFQEINVLFHGTPKAWDIIEDGFNVAHSSEENMFGKGVYFTDKSSKANQYSWGANQGCPRHNDIACDVCVRRMLICKCSMGRKFKPSYPKEPVPPGHHSVEADPHSNGDIARFLVHPEFVFFSKHQVLPLYLVEYRIKLKRQGRYVSPPPPFGRPVPVPRYNYSQSSSSGSSRGPSYQSSYRSQPVYDSSSSDEDEYYYY
ncbi:poly [ADP-ribose] polymerase tankyrase-1-like [Neocloeon triangulifer]|uniref:poly [ADP-ribose] polymerase tankyrase-1-like n=1 Tax=Neocloeon triangulifer TaxID=2078957 RepID=UPI00286ECADF|nr:poly [ADP-ribose] polymerase tankyrase-1-like [Neocloeon triangulifer]XP_059470413.1 poly [ADP-ribose] polymerase tankyrase-1-like [Neocloeon triangulifer]